jgi:alpha-beta hydrolase superfamily lysophospholipase
MTVSVEHAEFPQHDVASGMSIAHHAHHAHHAPDTNLSQLTAAAAATQADVYTIGADPSLEYWRWLAQTPRTSYTQVIVPGAGHQAILYARIAAALAANGITTIVLNLRGHGGSTLRTHQPLRKVRLADYVADVRTVIEDAQRRWGGIDQQTVLLGHSLGSFVAFGYAERYAVGGLIALGGPAPHCWMSTYGRAFLWMIAHHPLLVPEMMAWNPGAMFKTAQLRADLLLSTQTHPEYVSQVVTEELSQWVMKREAAGIATDIRAYARRGYAPVVTQRVLFLCGKDDWFFSQSCVRESAAAYSSALFPNGQAVFVDGPHNVMQAGDWPGAAHAIAAFIDSLPASPAIPVIPGTSVTPATAVPASTMQPPVER